MQRRPVVKPSRKLRHPRGLRPAELRQHDADRDIVDLRGVEVRVRGERGLQHVAEELVVVRVAEAALVGAGHWGAERGEDHDVRGGLGEDFFQPSRHGHGSGKRTEERQAGSLQ